MAAPQDPTLVSHRGGLNNTDALTEVPQDQVVYVRNVEFYESMLGERRRGTLEIDLTGSGFNEDVPAIL